MRRYSGYVFDLDGTVYLGDKLIPGAETAVGRLRARGAGVAFVTNNPLRTRADYAAKLARLGIPAEPEDVITAAAALVEELEREAPGSTVYVVGERPLRTQLESAGFRMADDPAATDFIILAFDRTFHYGKLRFAHDAVKHGARVWATNPDPVCPVDGGEIPDCASVTGAVEGCTGRKVERILGKPSPALAQAAARRMDVDIGDCLLLGDSIETDIRMARDAGCDSALVLTGVTTRAMLRDSPLQPDYVLTGIADLD